MIKKILFVLVLFLMTGVTARASETGAHFITPEQGAWEEQLAIFEAGNFTVGKVQIPKGFATEPHHVVDLIDAGATTIILRGEDCDPGKNRTRDDLIGRGFAELFQQYPGIQFIIEIGNEPSICGMEAPAYRAALIETGQEIIPLIEAPNVEWIASAPVKIGYFRTVLDDGEILSLYDGLGVHVYGHFNLTDAHKYEVYQYAQTYDVPLHLTEVGINDPATPTVEKARRIQSFLSEHPHETAVIFVIGEDSHWPQYEIDLPMAYEFNENCQFFPETQEPLCFGFKDYWHAYGGVRMFGYPLTGEIIENGQVTQYFERAVFEYHADNPDGWRILQRRLGAHAMERRYE